MANSSSQGSSIVILSYCNCFFVVYHVKMYIKLNVLELHLFFPFLSQQRTLSRYFNPCYATAQLKPTFISKVRVVTYYKISP